MASKSVEIPQEFVQPPKGTSARAREIWLEVVQSYPVGYFNDAHRMRLYTYCEATAFGEKLRHRMIRMGDPEGIKAISATIRVQEMTALQEARALRITQQSNRPPSMNPGERAREGNPAAPAGEDLGDSWKTLPFPASSRPN